MGSTAIPRIDHAGDDRVFHYAVLASIVLHGLALFAVPQLRLAAALPAGPGPIVARLAEPAAALPRAEQPKEEKLKEEKRPEPRRARPKAEPVRKPAPLAQREPAPSPSAPLSTPIEPLAEPPAAPSAETAPSAAPQSGAIARVEAQSVPPSLPAPAAPATGPDPGALGRYRMEIISLARQFKRYPPLARENNWVGRAEVRLSFDAEGRRTSVSIVRSSGYQVLDRQAIDTMTKAAVPVPAALRGSPFAVEIPMIFNLEEEGA